MFDHLLDRNSDVVIGKPLDRAPAAGWYGLHSANADTINYIIASSEVISTLGVIASFAVYFAFPRAAPVPSLRSPSSDRDSGQAACGDLRRALHDL